jgi:hypothetical protein
MSILLICRHESGQITLNAAHIGGVEVPKRDYVIEDHLVILDGYPASVLHHDADALLAIECEIYRMPTAGEQASFVQKQRAMGMIQEGQTSA